MPHRESKPIGEYGYTEKDYKCVICEANIHMSGYFLRDFEGYPIMGDGKRRDFLFPDGTNKEGLVCDKCGDNIKNKMKLKKSGDKWIWTE